MKNLSVDNIFKRHTSFCTFEDNCISSLIYDSEKMPFSSPSGDIITREKSTYTFSLKTLLNIIWDCQEHQKVTATHWLALSCNKANRFCATAQHCSEICTTQVMGKQQYCL